MHYGKDIRFFFSCKVINININYRSLTPKYFSASIPHLQSTASLYFYYYLVISDKPHTDFHLTPPHAPERPTPSLTGLGVGANRAGDEEGHVSLGRELTLQGAGKSWVGVLPSSDLFAAGERIQADAEELQERF